MLVGPCRTTATPLYDFEDRVDTDEVVRKNRYASFLRISRQFIGINASAAIHRVAIRVDRGIEDHRRSDPGAIGGGRRQAAVIGVLENHTSYIGRSPCHHGKQARP